MLIKLSVQTDCVKEWRCKIPPQEEELDENWFFGSIKRERSMTLSVRMQNISFGDISHWSSDPSFTSGNSKADRENCKIFLYVGASLETLSLLLTPRLDKGTPKILLSPCKKTPTGWPRKLSTCLMSSPSLRSRIVLMVGERLMELNYDSKNITNEDGR